MHCHRNFVTVIDRNCTVIQRGYAFSQKGDYDLAIADFNKAIEIDPIYDWAFEVRGRAYLWLGQFLKSHSDFAKAAELKPEDAYVVLWLDIVERRQNLPRQLSKRLLQLDMKSWPAPLIRLYLGEISADEALAAADNSDPKIKKGQLCEANFYSGELALLGGSKDQAIRLFGLAKRDCAHNYVEWTAARAELRLLDALH
jgi:lipoprotein NlpI